MARYVPNMTRNIKDLSLLGMIIVIVTLFALVLLRVDMRIIPVAFATMLITILFSSRLGLFINFILTAIVGIMIVLTGATTGTDSIYTLMMYLVGGSVGVYAVRYVQHRSTLAMAGIWVGIANVLTMVATGCITTSQSLDTLINAGWGFGNGLLCAVMCIGTLPVWEGLFGVITPTKLLELANPNHPLIKKLMMEAPGTYHHSIMVANLSEAAAEAIGANALLTRVGAYFHDVGKLRRPYYFTRKPDGERESARLKCPIPPACRSLSPIPRTGRRWPQRTALPKPVIDIILQHHGTTPVMYFYLKAKATEAEGKEVDINKFRYNCPKPQSKEAALVMMADSVEAAVRSINSHCPAEIKEKVTKLIKAKIDDGQFDECSITFKEVTLAIEALLAVFAGMFHERIEYPDSDFAKLKE